MSMYDALSVFGNEAEPQSLLVDRCIPSYFARSLHTEATAVLIRNDDKAPFIDLFYEITTKAQDGSSPCTISATLYRSMPPPPGHHISITYIPISALYGVTLSRGIRECTAVLKSSRLVSYLGLNKSIGWLELMHAMPLLETLRVESAAAAGKALFRSLYHDSD